MLIAAVKLLELHAMLLVPDMTNGYILPSRFLEWVVKTSHDIIHVLTITNSNVRLYFMHTKENKNNSTAKKHIVLSLTWFYKTLLVLHFVRG